MTKGKVISLAEERERIRAQERAARGALWTLLGIAPPSEKIAPEPPVQTKGKFSFKTGFADANNGREFRPTAKGKYYPCGYLEGILWREFGRKPDWMRIFKDVEADDTFEDDIAKRPKRRPRLAAKRYRDACVRLEMFALEVHNDRAMAQGRSGRSLDSIIAEIAVKFARSERTIWNIWCDDALDFSFRKWFEPKETTAIK